MYSYIYRPMLHWKQGEQRGLEKLSTKGAAGTIPNFIVQDEQYQTKRVKNGDYAKFFMEQLESTWQFDSPVSLDFGRLSKIEPRADHPLLQVLEENKSKKIIPTISLDTATDAYVQACQEAINDHGCDGLVLVIEKSDIASLLDITSDDTMLLGASKEKIDLIIDLKNNNLELTPSNFSDLVSNISELNSKGNWRSITLVGASVPTSLSGYENNNIHYLMRPELYLWIALSQAIQGFRLDYGDYAVVPLRGSLDATGEAIIKSRNFPISVKYTLSNNYMICQGVSDRKEDRSKQLRKHAQSIYNTPNRAPLEIWADDKINQIVNNPSSERPGNLTTWVAIGVNRHIERTRSDLA